MSESSSDRAERYDPATEKWGVVIPEDGSLRRLIEDEHGDTVAVVYGPDESERANLIAVVQQLYRALEALLFTYPNADPESQRPEWIAAREAIAAARGER